MKTLSAIAAFLLLACSAFADKLSQIDRAFVIYTNTLFYAVTNPGASDGSVYIRAWDLVNSLGTFANFPTNGGGGSSGGPFVLEQSGKATNLLVSQPVTFWNGNTNGSLTVTQECYISTQSDTNTVIVSGAGTAGANGTYRYVAGASYHFGGFGLKYDLAGHGAWTITNSAGTYLYFDLNEGLSPATTGWFSENGANPAPTSIFGDITNCFGSFIADRPLRIPFSTFVFVSTDGNDTNGVKGRLDRPFKTLYGAIAAASANDTILLGPGNFPSRETPLTTTTEEWRPPVGVRIIGFGPGVTTIGSSNDLGSLAEEIMRLKSDSIVANLSFFGAIYIGNAAFEATNCSFLNIDMVGERDCIYLEKWNGLVRIEDCNLLSAFDTVSNFDLNNRTNRMIRIKNSLIDAVKQAENFQDLHALQDAGAWTAWEVYNSRIKAQNGNTFNAAVSTIVATTNRGSILLSGCSIENSNTNGPTWAIYSTNQCAITVVNSTVTTNAIFLSGAGASTINIKEPLLDNLTLRSNLTVIGQVTFRGGTLGAGKVWTDSAGNGVGSWQTASGGGGGSVITNATQFGATADGSITIRSGATVTNALLQGNTIAATNGNFTLGDGVNLFNVTNYNSFWQLGGFTMPINGSRGQLWNVSWELLTNSYLAVGGTEGTANQVRFNTNSYIVDGVADSSEPNRYRFANGSSAVHSNDILRRRDLFRDVQAGSGITTSGTATNVTVAVNASGALDQLGSTRGSVIYRGAAGWSTLVPSTSGQFLQTAGAGADPLWSPVTASAGGNTTEIQFNRGGILGATNTFTIDATNNRIAINMQNLRLNATIELGIVNGVDPSIRIGGTANHTNTVNPVGMATLTANSLQFSPQNTANPFYVDTNFVGFQQPNHGDLGSSQYPWRTNVVRDMRIQGILQTDASAISASDIDWAGASFRTKTLVGNVTFTFSNLADDRWLSVLLVQDGTGTRTVAWPAGIKWMGSTNQTDAPQVNTNANGYTLMKFTRSSGTVLGWQSSPDSIALQDIANITGLAKGDLIVWDNTHMVRLARGTDGQHLISSNASSTGVAWVDQNASAGEANVNGESAVTNATRLGWVWGKQGVTNLLRSFEPLELLSAINQGGTNLQLRINNAALTNGAGTGIASNHVGMYRTIYVDAAAMVSNITAGATFQTEESKGAAETTNKMIDSYVFDGATSNSVQFKLAMPLEWDLSTVKVKLWTWSTNNVATRTNIWGVSAFAAKEGSVLTNITWGTEQKLTNVVSSDAGAMHLTNPTQALTVGNTPAAAGNLVWWRVRRLPGNADDNDVGLQQLLGAWIQYKEGLTEPASW